VNDSTGVVVAIVVVVGTAIVMLGVGLRLGMLVAPRLTRWAERDTDEDPGEPDPQP